MSKHKQESMRDEFNRRRGKMASVADAARYAEQAARHYSKDKPSRIEVQMMIDAAVGSPWALFMAWCRHTLRTVTGARKAMEARFRSEQNEQRAIADDVAEQLDPAINPTALRDELEAMDEVEDEAHSGQARVMGADGLNGIVRPLADLGPSKIIRSAR